MSLAPYQDPNRFLADRRQQLGLSPEDLTTKTGFSIDPSRAAAMIDLIEKDRVQIPLRKCREFAAALKVDESWFVLCLLQKQYPEAAAALAPVVSRASTFH